MRERPATVRLVVADDHQVVREGFAGLLATQSDFSVVGTARDGAEAIRVCRELDPREIDGDTIEVRRADGVTGRVRLIGINSPELAHDGQPAQCGAKMARDLVDGGPLDKPEKQACDMDHNPCGQGLQTISKGNVGNVEYTFNVHADVYQQYLGRPSSSFSANRHGVPDGCSSCVGKTVRQVRRGF